MKTILTDNNNVIQSNLNNQCLSISIKHTNSISANTQSRNSSLAPSASMFSSDASFASDM